MNPIYLDHAATSWPKPPCVIRAARNALHSALGNPGRSTHSAALESARIVLEARESVGRLFHARAENVIFTYNTSYALNLAITGAAKTLRHPKNTVLTDEFQHNSVLRPLYALRDQGVIRLRFCSPYHPENAMDDSVGLGVFSARSNVTGESFPTAKIGRILHGAGAVFICDGAQAAGNRTIDIEKEEIDVLCIPGHKGLMGIMGSGAMILSDRCPPLIPLLSGGSGSMSDSPYMPELPPERYEAGTLGVPAIASMGAGAEYVEQRGADALGRHEAALGNEFLAQIAGVRGLRIYSPRNSGGIILLNLDGISPHDLATALDDRGICTRSGFHCAPLIHNKLNTGSDGALRISFGAFNTSADALAAATALWEIASADRFPRGE